MKREFHVIIEKDKAGFFVATVPELRGCHTQAKSLDSLMKRVREAIELCLEVGDKSCVRGNSAGTPRVSLHHSIVLESVWLTFLAEPPFAR